MFEWNAVVLFKPHPQLLAYHAVMELALAPLAAGGYYRSASCGLELTKTMVYHPLVGGGGAGGAAASAMTC
jgi:hypothetical protein